MNSTKQKILSNSLDLYNRKGLAAISLRDISKDCAISPGNLTYHFKRKEEIPEALYFEFVESIAIESKEMLSQPITFESYVSLTRQWFLLMYRYRFIFVDIAQLMRNNAKISANYIQLTKIRASLFNKVIEAFLLQKLIKPAVLENEYRTLYDRLQIISDYYLTYISVSGKKPTNKIQEKHLILFFETFYPYLTAKGKKAFTQYVMLTNKEL